MKYIKKPQWTKEIITIKSLSPKIEVYEFTEPSKYAPTRIVMDIKKIKKEYEEK